MDRVTLGRFIAAIGGAAAAAVAFAIACTQFWPEVTAVSAALMHGHMPTAPHVSVFSPPRAFVAAGVALSGAFVRSLYALSPAGGGRLKKTLPVSVIVTAAVISLVALSWEPLGGSNWPGLWAIVVFVLTIGGTILQDVVTD